MNESITQLVFLFVCFHKFLIQDDENGESTNKRAWNQMQGVWGKRALSAMAAGYKRNWNNLRGAWGKREIPAAVAKGFVRSMFYKIDIFF